MQTLRSLENETFHDRIDAGRRLASKLERYRNRPDVVVLALPRGGVPVAHEVAQALGAPLDVFVVRKLGVPGHEELAMGAIASGGVRIVNEAVIESLAIADAAVAAAAVIEERELDRRESLYRGDRSPLDVRGRTVIIVDDGLATGATMRAAVAALKGRGAAEVVVAVPVAAEQSARELASEVDDIVCVLCPTRMYAVGEWYDDFRQTTDEEVRDILK